MCILNIKTFIHKICIDRFTKAKDEGLGFSLPKIKTDMLKEYDKYDKRIILEEMMPGF